MSRVPYPAQTPPLPEEPEAQSPSVLEERGAQSPSIRAEHGARLEGSSGRLRDAVVGGTSAVVGGAGAGTPSDVVVGVLALQGGVREHVELLTSLGTRVVLLRQPQDLVGPDGLLVDALVLPGGESSTIDRLLRLFGLFQPLREAIASGVPTLGTCAGLILLAQDVLDPAPGQQSLGILDISVQRNAYGSQVDSAEVDLETALGPAHVAFIRAPRVDRLGAGVEVLATYRGGVVAVRQGSIIGISFHPELTGESLFHRELLRSVAGRPRRSAADQTRPASPPVEGERR